jgi:putative ABC transport system permease protein
MLWMLWLWIAGLARARFGRLLGTMIGIAFAVALLASLGTFLRTSTVTMTQRAIAAVTVDWQIQLLPAANRAMIEEEARNLVPVEKAQWVSFADVSGFETVSGETTQTTGAGKVLGIEASYFAAFPAEIRLLLGSLDGVLVAQQTAANLHVGPGDTISVDRISLPDATVTVAGIVELPQADTLFQGVGIPPSAAPQAPPDNVLLLPIPLWHDLFDAQAAARPDTVRDQLHLGLDHSGLPQDPVGAFVGATRQGNAFEARAVGRALLANNLAARLGAVREDALYAKVLFLFLGAPGAVMAILLTVIVAASGVERRRRDEALLRVRGVSAAQLTELSATEAVAVGIGGGLAGLVLAEISSRWSFGTGVLTKSGLPWLALALMVGMVVALGAILLPSWRRARFSTVVAARRAVELERASLWARSYLDIVLLGLAALVFWRSAEAGYQVVLAPEGVAGTAVDYTAFLAPLLLWAGLGLLTVRLSRIGLSCGRSTVSALIAPIAGSLSRIIAATFARQSRRLTAGIALAALAFAFASSTAIFNTTYQAQARVDAELTNGADVTVTATTAALASDALDRLREVPGVIAAESMQHRYAYVGTDLQDLYAIDPACIGLATNMANAYFASGDAQATLAALAGTPDGVLASLETVTGYQLRIGDTINLRLQNAADHQYRSVPFRFIGIVREFPTAPKDSFLVANASYVAAQTGSPAQEVVLMRIKGDPGQVAAEATRIMAGTPGAKVSDVGQAHQVIGSSLTAVDLAGLTRLELGFALLMAAASVGLVLGLGLADRQRSFAILIALGAKPHQVGAFIWSEAALVLLGGGVIGLLSGGMVAYMLVMLLTGVFDPPPEALAAPWSYLATLMAAAACAVALAVFGALRSAQVAVIEKLRGRG